MLRAMMKFWITLLAMLMAGLLLGKVNASTLVWISIAFAVGIMLVAQLPRLARILIMSSVAGAVVGVWLVVSQDGPDL